jgi:hypothetical protein
VGLTPDLGDPCLGKHGPEKRYDREYSQDLPKQGHRREPAGTVSEAGSTASEMFLVTPA